MDINYRDKKLYKVHVDLTFSCQMYNKKIPVSLSILANNEQEAKNIAQHVRISNISVGKVKEEFDFKEYLKDK